MARRVRSGKSGPSAGPKSVHQAYAAGAGTRNVWRKRYRSETQATSAPVGSRKGASFFKHTVGPGNRACGRDEVSEVAARGVKPG